MSSDIRAVPDLKMVSVSTG